jgi:hypothetical protein
MCEGAQSVSFLMRRLMLPGASMSRAALNPKIKQVATSVDGLLPDGRSRRDPPEHRLEEIRWARWNLADVDTL